MLLNKILTFFLFMSFLLINFGFSTPMKTNEEDIVFSEFGSMEENANQLDVIQVEKIHRYKLSVVPNFQEKPTHANFSTKFGEANHPKPLNSISDHKIIEPYRFKAPHYQVDSADFWVKGLKAGLTIQF